MAKEHFKSVGMSPFFGHFVYGSDSLASTVRTGDTPHRHLLGGRTDEPKAR